MQTFFFQSQDLPAFYDAIAQKYRLFVPVKAAGAQRVACEYGAELPTVEYACQEYSQAKKGEIVFNEYRTFEPARTFFTQVKEKVCGYFAAAPRPIGGAGMPLSAAESRTPALPFAQGDAAPLAIVGFKNCDLFSLKIQDFVFLGGDDPDPLYQKRRESALIISGDCPHFKEVCFCRAFDIEPYATEGFDMNLSVMDDGYLLDVATQKAQLVLEAFSDKLSPAASSQLNRRNLRRASVARLLDEHLIHHKIPKKETLQEIVTAGLNSGVWQEQMQTCVECGGCVAMCDTCHCFLLADEKRERDVERIRVLDGCMYKNFTRVAGGANSLKLRYQRLRNRYLKKFDFFIANMGIQACCGCGRCIDVCPGKIDIRSILRRLYDEKHLSTH